MLFVLVNLDIPPGQKPHHSEIIPHKHHNACLVGDLWEAMIWTDAQTNHIDLEAMGMTVQKMIQ